MPASPRADTLPLVVRFARPGRLPPVSSLPGRVAVLDLALDSRRPEHGLAWIERLGKDLAVWIDHHDQPAWRGLENRPAFVLVPRSEAPACPPLVTAERVQRYSPVATLLAHGDFDGVMSAAKWLLLAEGLEPMAWIDPDSIAADTRKGSLTERGERLDRVLRTASDHDRLRRAVCASVLAEARGVAEDPEVRALLERQLLVHERMRESTRRALELATPLEDLDEDVVLVDLRRLSAETRIDLTELMLTLQPRHDWVLVIARGAGGATKVVASTDPERSGLDLREEFGLSGFAPFRVHVPDRNLLQRLPSGSLEAALART